MFSRNRNSPEKTSESEDAGRSSFPIVNLDSSQDPERHDTKPFPRIETYSVTSTQNSSVHSIPTTSIDTSDSPLPVKPVPLTRLPSVHTRYMEMLLHLDEISSTYNILASVFAWIILAGFLVVPGTFTTFKKTKTFQDLDDDDSNEVAHTIVHTVAHIGLLWLAGAFCAIGALGCFWLWFRWRKNYIWLINRIFLPVTLNSVAGLITTLVNVYTAQKGIWSVTAKITAVVTGSCVAAGGFLFAIYNFWALARVKEAHVRDMGLELPTDGETSVNKVKAKG
ncbi:hypothetical protein HRR83_001777 [Exophiala dermatitidis]|uniref:Uncharacterized protein n=2 Tax=Exophiala dermatitidis TaxID=5970 RepID=H6C5B1_EXODN|nr:uncharacterized protein HMPREF1120_06960 [Exophiala dermatitidis NIH/UT8656]KAJ4516445.1 hypothetical protein HRR73_004910 [Exophiala dermatitidis]EHY58958.1 hypothetical protein HMPREF1120_06960 [Exophiala dermatitidis NIH/UT8656]KAJ4523242.1 hypothetical protein HRR75_001643 [Exophiala dermatitidis]KAJ4526580.1 hypothetical protein HRR74_001780 [Exophiala dermatitidis]KAJ4532171.1 hypothetical protein HRR76_007169 [Exophiala dermatitidis]